MTTKIDQVHKIGIKLILWTASSFYWKLMCTQTESQHWAAIVRLES